ERYGGVPIITKNYGLSDDFRVARNNFDECVKFIEDDLDIAEQMLPDKGKTAKGRINKDIAIALRARLLLVAASPLFNDPTQPDNCLFRGAYDKNKWQKAYDANKAMVDRADVDGAYALDPKYSGVWCTDNSPEVIWGKYFPQSGFMNKAQLLYSVEYFNGWTSLEPTQAMQMDYEMTNGKKFFEEGSGYDPQKPYANRDPRFYYSIAHPFSIYKSTDSKGQHEDELLLYLQYVDKSIDDFALGKAEPSPTAKAKHLWHQTNTTGLELNKWYIPTRKISDDETGTILYPWFRLGEFYLNLAECAYMLGKEDECRTYINKIRAREDVQMPPVTESGESLWDRLVNERRIELAFETFRYFDLRRWKTAPMYESINFAGMRTMLLERDNGKQIDTVYRMVRLYDPSKNNTCYYWDNTDTKNVYKNNAGEDIATVITYRWLGKEYKIDFGDCPLNFSPTPKLFPQERPQGPSYLKDGVVVCNQPVNDGVIYPNYLMPIPRNEMTKSEGELQQNPGY
ncbi:MAG: RagB/SusD family nutrient uptake outer membrane protein, partial [Bacteroidales bacterium]|nr:RagB/SusD family nutrient uptake outer membrane protein [Bacteroidales bacterium]